MLIGGIQKLSLIDFPGKIAAVVFAQGCDFLCPFCHNPELIPPSGNGMILESDVLNFLSDNLKMLEGVCVTGGEPTGRSDLPEFIRKIRSLGLAVKLDTNGSSPEMIANLLSLDLVDYIAMDIKAAWENYPRAIRSLHAAAAAEKVKKSLSLISGSGIDHEFRTTVFPGVHSMDDFVSIAGYLHDGEKYFIQNIRLDKTLDEIVSEERLSASAIAGELKKVFPHLHIDWR
jgi:pyruvate formate lyase activating enzyme